MKRRLASPWLLLLVPALLTSCLAANRPAKTSQPSLIGRVSIHQTNYHRWPESFVLENGLVQAVVIPAIGRVMQFGFRGEEGVFWENRKLDGQALSCERKDWINFGGDKTWPAPEVDWSKRTGRRDWHPPQAFDCMPLAAKIDGDDLVLTSPVDPNYNIRTIRRVQLDRFLPLMTITTTYERVSGEPARVGVWIITQLKDPVRIYAALPENPEQISECVVLGKEKPPTLTLTNSLASLARDSTNSYKVGFESHTLIWVGERDVLRIDSPRIKSATYPDQGSSAEVYTNSDPLKYVELEMLGPLHDLKPGEKISQTNRYFLLRRTEKDPDQQVHRALALRLPP